VCFKTSDDLTVSKYFPVQLSTDFDGALVFFFFKIPRLRPFDLLVGETVHEDALW